MAANVTFPVLSMMNSIGGIVGTFGGGIFALLVFWAKMAKYQQRVDDLKEGHDKLIQKIEHLRTDVDTFKEFKINAQKFIDSHLFKGSSPLVLTELGSELVQQSGFAIIFETEKDNLAHLLEKKVPKTKYDTQEMAREMMDDLKEYSAFTSIKAYAYESGKDFGQILRAGAILLRDYYLTIHPEIKD